MGEILDYFKQKKNLVNLLLLGILVLALPLGVNLVKQQQIIKSRATVEPIRFTGSNVTQSGGVWTATSTRVSLILNSPLGPAAVQTVESKDSPIALWPQSLVKTAYAAGTCTYSTNTSQCASGVAICKGTGCNGFNCSGCNYDGSLNTGSGPGGCDCTASSPSGGGGGGGGSGSSGGGGTSGGTSTGKRECKSTFTPSELGINSPGVCDRLHQYVAIDNCTRWCPQNPQNYSNPNEDCPKNTDPSQRAFINPDTSAWCYEFKGPVGDPRNNKCLQLRYIGDGSERSCAPGEGGGGPAGCQGLDACSECVLLKRDDILPFYASNGWDTSCGNQANVVRDWCRIDPNGCQGVKSGQCASSCRGSTTTTTTFTTQFRLAEDLTTLDNPDLWQRYEGHGMTVNHNFGSDGQKTIFVEFKDSTGKEGGCGTNQTEPCSAQITISGANPATSQLTLGARVFCRAPSSHDTANVDLILVGNFAGGTKISQKVTIDREGAIQGLTQQLQEGKQYTASLKAPGSLRRNITFLAGSDTTNISGFVLPVGDIFPADGGDGTINSLDKAELNRQWNISGDTTNRSGDFNQDGRVNSIDWACMRYDFGQPADPEPVAGGPSPSPSSSPSPSPTPTPSPSPSASVSPSPSPSVSPSPSPGT